MKQTAVEWFESMLKNWDVLLPEIKKAIIEQAIEMEKEQIMYAFDFGVYDGGGIIKKYEMSGKQYYNETFKSE